MSPSISSCLCRALLAGVVVIGLAAPATAGAYVTNPATIWTIAGDGTGCVTPTGSCGDGPSAINAQFSTPTGAALDTAGNVYIADRYDHKIRKVTPAGAISTIAGDGTQCAAPTGSCGDGPSAASAQLNTPYGVAVDGAGNVYIADTSDHKIRKVTPAGAISTIAGDGTQCAAPTGICGDGPSATGAHLNFPGSVAVDAAGNVYIADSLNQKIREVTPAGAISTIAGDGNACAVTTGPCGDGPSATSAQLDEPEGVAVDGAGNVYIVDHIGEKVRKLTPAGAISTIAGNGNLCSTTSCGDGSIATNAQLNNPRGVAVDAAGNVYIADTRDGKVRKLTPAGAIFTIVGDGVVCATPSTCGDGGAGTSARLDPSGVAVDAGGQNLFVTDEQAGLVRWLAGPQAGAGGAAGAPGPTGGSGTAGVQGIPGAPGAAGTPGRSGPPGAQGAPGKVQIVTCKTPLKKTGGKKSKRQRCTAYLVNGPVSFATAAAALVRGTVTYARGSARYGSVTLAAPRAVHAGHYVLVLSVTGRKGRRATLRQAVLIA